MRKKTNTRPAWDITCRVLNRNVPTLKTNRMKKLMVGSLLNPGFDAARAIFHIMALMIERPRSSYYRRVSVTFSDQAGKEFLHA